MNALNQYYDSMVKCLEQELGPYYAPLTLLLDKNGIVALIFVGPCDPVATRNGKDGTLSQHGTL